MAKTILTTEQVKSESVVHGFQTHLNFQREGGTHDVVIQAIDTKKDETIDTNWRNIYRIRAADTYRQQIAIVASDGYKYRAILDGTPSTNGDTEVTMSETVDDNRNRETNRFLT